MVDVPVMDEWIQGSPQLNGLRGATISVPIRGTTSSPQVDRRALSQATLQLAQRQAATYLQGQLNEKLGGDLQDVLGGAIGGLLNGGQNPSTSEPNRDPNAQRKLETQLQDRAREEVWERTEQTIRLTVRTPNRPDNTRLLLMARRSIPKVLMGRLSCLV